MGLTLPQIEAAAPDQASLKAASKLMKSGKWPVRAQDSSAGLIWGECQGSGANPYRVVADTGNLGAKCSCPSRKFPCKHALALMWLYAEGAGAFAVQDIPEWVNEWQGRRRDPGAAKPAAAKSKAGAKNAAAAIAEHDAPPDPKAEEKRRAAAVKRAAATQASVADGLQILEQWISDQLRLGLGAFVADAQGRCRQISARLVDAKAATLARRLDDFPSRLMAASSEERIDTAIIELGKLVTLARAWRAAPDDPGLRRDVIGAETRDQILTSDAAPRVKATWEVLGERVSNHRDNFISQASWLMNLTDAGPRFALLLDFFPRESGRRGAAFHSGEQFDAEIAFYPGSWPLRGLIAERGPTIDAPLPWPDPPQGAPISQDAALWATSAPIFLPSGRVCEAKGGRWWWTGAGGATLPLTQAPDPVWRGAVLTSAAGVWVNGRLDLLAGQAQFGRIDGDG